MQYVEHLEHKFDGEIGVLERKHVHAVSVLYIGKEANNIDEQELDVKKAQEFVDVEKIYNQFLKSPKTLSDDLADFHNISDEVKAQYQLLYNEK